MSLAKSNTWLGLSSGILRYYFYNKCIGIKNQMGVPRISQNRNFIRTVLL